MSVVLNVYKTQKGFWEGELVATPEVCFYFNRNPITGAPFTTMEEVRDHGLDTAATFGVAEDKVVVQVPLGFSDDVDTGIFNVL